MIDVSKKEVDHIIELFNVMLDWSGITDDTEDDTEILGMGDRQITLADVRDACSTLNKLSVAIQTKKL